MKDRAVTFGRSQGGRGAEDTAEDEEWRRVRCLVYYTVLLNVKWGWYKLL